MPSILQQIKVDIEPMEQCRNWFYERWSELFPFRVPYDAPISEKYHHCVGSNAYPDPNVCYVS